MKHQNFDNVAFAADLGTLHRFDAGIKIGRPSWLFAALKRCVDIVVCLFLLPVLIVVGAVLLIVNPFHNKGALLFVQKRMGQGTGAFQAIKFRSMSHASGVERGAHDPLEVHRITRLGHFLRKSRLDELPQIINVLKGEMSLIGPRPDHYGHAVEYLDSVPGYRARHAVKPGISGFAQTEVGYADTPDAVATKVAADLYYIRHRRTRLEAWIFWRTLVTVFGRKGA